MINRRKFLEKTAALGALGILPGFLQSKTTTPSLPPVKKNNYPAFLSTWKHGIPSNEAAMKELLKGGTVLDAVEQGVHVPEGDPNNHSVGLGGTPDRDGHVTLDACIMGPDGNAGSVCFLEDIVHPISVARLVMDKTPHVMLSGVGALQFALDSGFKKVNLLTPEMKARWQKWLKKSDYHPEVNWENHPNEFHDTIGMIGIDKNGEMAGACTTSGLGYKMRGRVGDSPIIGAGLFVDNEVGGAAATGMGELVMKTLGTFLVVEFMRNGATPQEACEKAVQRIVRKIPDNGKFQVGFIAMNKSGETGAYSLKPGFNFALFQKGENRLIDSKSYY